MHLIFFFFHYLSKFYRQILKIFYFFRLLIVYEYKFLNGIPVLSAAKVFSYGNEPNGDATKAIDDVFGLAVQFFYELLCWQIKGNSD